MSEISKYEAYKKKLQGICDENDLTFRFQRDTYPITLTIQPVVGLSEQLSFTKDESSDRTSPDASLVFYFKDGAITYKTTETFVISDALFAKIKNLFKNIHYCWLQYFFRDIIERKLLASAVMPVIDEQDTNDTDILPDDAEPLEELEDFDDITVDKDYESVTFERDDPDIVEATRIVRMENKASTSLLRRRMNVDSNRACDIMVALEKFGVVGPYNNGESREVLPYDEPDDAEGVDNE